MNIEQANAIPLSSILEKIGAKSTAQKGKEIWYLSPFRNEKTASFHIHTSKNVWKDFGNMKGGDVIDFVVAYLESRNEDHTKADALRWIRNMHPQTSFDIVLKDREIEYASALEVRNVITIENQKLIKYLQERGISFSLAKKYLKEVHVQNLNTGINFYALGWKNEGGGIELRNEKIKSCVKPKSITFIRGSKQVPDEIHVFEGMMDFLSMLAMQKKDKLEEDVIILNSIGILSHAFPYIKNYHYTKLYSWLNNDDAGTRTTELLRDYCREVAKVFVKPMNKIYLPHKDVNEAHVKMLAFKNQPKVLKGDRQ